MFQSNISCLLHGFIYGHCLWMLPSLVASTHFGIFFCTLLCSKIKIDVITFIKNLLNYFILCPVLLCIDRLRSFMLCIFILVPSLIRIRFFNLLQSFSISMCHFSVCNVLHRTVECLGFNRFSWMEFKGQIGGLKFTTHIWSLVIVWEIK